MDGTWMLSTEEENEGSVESTSAHARFSVIEGFKIREVIKCDEWWFIITNHFIQFSSKPLHCHLNLEFQLRISLCSFLIIVGQNLFFSLLKDVTKCLLTWIKLKMSERLKSHSASELSAPSNVSKHLSDPKGQACQMPFNHFLTFKCRLIPLCIRRCGSKFPLHLVLTQWRGDLELLSSLKRKTVQA